MNLLRPPLWEAGNQLPASFWGFRAGVWTVYDEGNYTSKYSIQRHGYFIDANTSTV
jgi:hypothetical protein